MLFAFAEFVSKGNTAFVLSQLDLNDHCWGRTGGLPLSSPSHRGTGRVHEEGPDVAVPRELETGDLASGGSDGVCPGVLRVSLGRGGVLPPCPQALPGDLGALSALTLHGADQPTLGCSV